MRAWLGVSGNSASPASNSLAAGSVSWLGTGLTGLCMTARSTNRAFRLLLGAASSQLLPPQVLAGYRAEAEPRLRLQLQSFRGGRQVLEM